MNTYIEFKEYFQISWIKLLRHLYPEYSYSIIDAPCNYALIGDGKRIRPSLTLIANHLLGGTLVEALPCASAIEMVHTYSLVHDDLPAMDNDILRRGRPTVHIKFDEGLAILCGDGLLTDAFTLLSGKYNEDIFGIHPTKISPEKKIQMVEILSLAIGSKGMVKGQALDLYWTARPDYTLSILEEIHVNKTAKLFGASFALGALVAESSSSKEVEVFFSLGEKLGHAFQILDDLLDQNANTGKSQGKDLKQNKLTYLKIMNREQAKNKADNLLAEVRCGLQKYTENLQAFSDLLNLFLSQKS